MWVGPPLAYPADQDFEDLTGIAINPDIFDVMAEYYPTLETEGTYHSDPIGDVLDEFDDGQFDAIYSVETL